MKKIYYFLAASFIAIGLTACSLKEDADFDEMASQRSEANLSEINNVLQSAPNGWHVQYYGDLNFGGYNMMMKFVGDSVTVASEQFGAHHKAGFDADDKLVTTTSHYKLEQSMGSILSFDQYNETFHYFSMPDNPDYSYDKANGLYGDFEFRVITARQDSVIMRGKKHNNRIVMTPIPTDKTWDSYITEAKETEEYMASSQYFLSGADRTDSIEISVTTSGSNRCLIFTYVDTTGLKQTVAAPYIVEKDGYNFYAPVEVNGLTLDGVLRGESQDYFLFRNNPNLQLDSEMPTLLEQVLQNPWYFNYASLGEYATPKWDAMMEILKTAGKNKAKIKIYTATFGWLSDTKVGSSLSTSDATPYWYMTAQTVGADDIIKFSQKSTGTNKTDKAYYNNYKWKDVLNTIYGHTFKVTTDNQRHPTYLTLTDVNEPTNVITIYATPMYFMNDQSYYDD